MKTLTLKAGRYYKRRDGRVVGPAHYDDPDCSQAPWYIDGLWYSRSGKVYGGCDLADSDLISEVPAKPKKAKRREVKGRKITGWAFTYRHVSGHPPNSPKSGIVCSNKYLFYNGILDMLRRWYGASRDHGITTEFGPITRIEIPAPKGKK